MTGNFPGYLGIPVSVEVEPILTERLAMTMDQFRVFPAGFKAELTVIARPGQYLDEELAFRRRTRGEGRMRIGLELADGRRGYPLDDRVAGGAFTIVERGGGGSAFRLRRRLWIHVVPPPGTMRLVAMWPAEGLAETAMSIPTEGIIDAIGRVGPLWTD